MISQIQCISFQNSEMSSARLMPYKLFASLFDLYEPYNQLQLSGSRTWRFNTANSKASQWTWSWVISTHLPCWQPISVSSILMLSSHNLLHLPCGCFPPNSVCIPCPFNLATCPAHHSLLHFIIIQSWVTCIIIKIPVM